jgi:mevalonate kinase
MSSNPFYSKILLFGEYSVMLNSMALSIPYHLFQGQLQFGKGEKKVDFELKSFGQYLNRLQEKGQLGFKLDVSSFLFDVGQGLNFDSTIPMGFGVGSSGALVAAVYDRYGQKKSAIDPEKVDLNQLKRIFSQMEGHFHGSSSGVDPLISYLDSAILVDGDSVLKPINTPQDSDGEGGLFLLNTGRPRKTEPLVNLFLEKLKNKDFKQHCEEKIIPITNHCIFSFIANDKDSFWSNFRTLSELQFESFNPMIPNLHKDLWLTGLESDVFSLKLCGAGGGGFLLGLAKDLDLARKSLQNYEIRPVLRF